MNAHADETSGVFNLFGVGDVLNVTPFPLIEYNALCSSYGSNSSNITTSKTKATATATKSSYPSNTPSGYGSCSADPFFQSLFKCGPNIVNDLNQIKNDMNPSSPNPSAAINPLNDVFGSLCSSSCLTSAGGVLSGLVANVMYCSLLAAYYLCSNVQIVDTPPSSTLTVSRKY